MGAPNRKAGREGYNCLKWLTRVFTPNFFIFLEKKSVAINRVNLASLQVKRDNLAEEARIIRRKEIKAKKWISRTLKSEVPFGDNTIKDLESRKWQVTVQPHGYKGMTAEERETYKLRKWKYTARLRKLNRNYNEAVRYSLWEHRTTVVRPEARATNLAIAYMKGVPYSVVETPAKSKSKRFQNRPDPKRIWKIVQKRPLVNDESVEDIKHLESWLEGWDTAPPLKE